MRFEQFNLSDAVAGNARFIGHGTDDVADAHPITLAGGQEDALLAVHHRRIRLLAGGDGRAHRTGSRRPGPCRHEFAARPLVQSQRGGGNFERVVRVEQRRKQCHFAG